MSRTHQLLNLSGVLVPFLGFIVALGLLWNTWVHWSSLAVMLAMYVLTCLGVTLGFHRLLTHRSFQTYKGVQYAIAAIGSMGVQGALMLWGAGHPQDHRATCP